MTATTIKIYPRIFITRGLPGAGKTTWADSLKLYAGVVNVCLDDIRAMAGLKNYSKPNEKLAFEILLNCIQAGIDNCKDVIVSNTNLTPHRPSEIYKRFKHHADIYIVDFSDVSDERASAQNKLRVGTDAYVDQLVIDKFVRLRDKYANSKLWNKFTVTTRDEAEKILFTTKRRTRTFNFYEPDTSLPSTAIVDLDGTLAVLCNRSPFDHTLYHTDLLHSGIAAACKGFERVILLTGRNESNREATEAWLKKQEFLNYDKLIMRPDNDKRPDFEYKMDIFFSTIAPNYNVELVFEDRKQVVDMWRNIGLTCAQVDEGNF